MFQLQMHPPSGNIVPASNNGVLTQVFDINNPQQVSVIYYSIVYSVIVLSTL